VQNLVGVIGADDSSALLRDAFMALGSTERDLISFTRSGSDGPTSGVAQISELSANLAQAHCVIAGRGERQAREASECIGAMLIGRVTNLRPLRRRLVAAGRAQPTDDASALMTSLLSLFMERRTTIEDALSAACEHVLGRYALVAFAATPGTGTVLAGIQRGHPLWVGLSSGSTIVTSHRSALSAARFDSTELEAGDIAVASGERLTLTDTGGMQIRRSPTPVSGIARSNTSSIPAL
jgi:glucosamine 6-phosphate synthetase-like amidotransferase/phosphosugar isomerase protein